MKASKTRCCFGKILVRVETKWHAALEVEKFLQIIFLLHDMATDAGAKIG